MKNTKIKNVSALEDSFILVKQEYGKKEVQEKKKVKIGKIGERIKENICLSVSRSSDLYSYYVSEYHRGIEKDHYGNAIVPPELILKRK